MDLFMMKATRLAFSGAYGDTFSIDDIARDFEVYFLQPISLTYGKPGVDFVEFRNYLSTKDKISVIYIETYTLSEPSDEKALLQTARCIGRTLRQQEPAKVTDIPFARVYYTSDLSVTTMGQTPLRYLMDMGYRPIFQVIRRGIRFSDLGQPSIDLYRDFMVEVSYMTTIRSIFMVPFVSTELTSLLNTSLVETFELSNSPEEKTRQELEAEIEKRLQDKQENGTLSNLSPYKILSPLHNSLEAFEINVWTVCKMDEASAMRGAIERVCAKIEGIYSGLLFANPLEL
ncbi:Hypothetical protein DHA2_8909 [Giardia duodenalis]|uniref:Uncharacterized protein n=1 Tax=Giardia intestinalis TaxID=5741 RepID=V6TJ60_GIAIN|nr:Hypothetical protein DHA2_8909 [Giardia intestinalis]